MDPGGLTPTTAATVLRWHLVGRDVLIAELDELKRTSPLRLGDEASEYSHMRADFQKFIRSDTELDLGTEDCVRWIWRALRDGAELAIAQNAAL